MPRVYDTLHAMARRRMLRERPGHTLQPTALIHEAYLRLIDQRVSWQGRNHFLRIAATCMRRVVLQHARRHAAEKRGGMGTDLTLDEARLGRQARPVDLLDLDAALERLHDSAPRRVAVVELRFYGGFTMPEIADILEVSESTVHREWKAARAWLAETLAG